ncbi:hypothetical protein FCH28_20245 [Streptomyces piniterrae]|uniref:Tetratricopeptide repeat protein n=1 Tax=Streptomyces piniterrae TaxID=2571125 RepID=A0A4U0NDN0_9ACTN|nr:hypothetical protein [Streptomyces piniterrae]TJZ52157.1 hypothetical protein FCH28_20245 [Streptomyces piniterrae]
MNAVNGGSGGRDGIGGSVDNSISGGTFGPVVQAGQATVHFHGITPPRVPRMRPPSPEGFVDREGVRARLDALCGARDGRTSAQIAVISGPPGMGKTGLLVHWAAGREAEFPGGVFYADLSPRGSLSPCDPAGVLEAFIGALGTPRAEMPAGTANLAAYFTSLTAGAPCLVLLDGVVNPAQVVPLLPGHPASMVVLTSRQRLSGLRALAPSRPRYFPLAGLDDAACTQLFRRASEMDEPEEMGGTEELDETGAVRAESEPDALRVVIPALGGLPLAARIAGARAADPFGGGVRELARQLTMQRPLLEALTVPDDYPAALRVAFGGLYHSLDAETAYVFRALGSHPTPEFADGLVEALAGGGMAGARARRALLEANLLDPAGEGRCRMNRLVHEYARELAGAEGAEPDGAGSVVDWYVRRAAATEALVSQRWRFGPMFAHPALLAAVFDSREQALDAMEADRENLAAVVELAYGKRRYDIVCQLVEALHGFFFRRKHHVLWIEVCGRGVRAAERLGNDGVLVAARMHYEMGFALIDRGSDEDLAAAREHYGRALALAREAAHPRTESSALEGLGQIASRQGRPLEALDLFGQALRALGSLDHPRGRALLELHRGVAAGAAGEHEEAAGLLLSARRQFAGLPEPDRFNEAKSLTRYAQARLAADRPDEALARIEEALRLFAERAVDAPKERADALLVRGDALGAQGERERARADWESALAVYRRLGSLQAEQALRRLAGTTPGQGRDQGQR